MKDYLLTKSNAELFFYDIRAELEASSELVVTTQEAKVGKWGMTRLWRSWMARTAEFMASNGVTMPLMIDKYGVIYKTRPFNERDAHELFTGQWLGVDDKGDRLSWSKQGRDGMRQATKGERYYALNRHELWALEKGLVLFKPRDSEYEQMMKSETES